jgi:hypothetical protein
MQNYTERRGLSRESYSSNIRALCIHCCWRVLGFRNGLDILIVCALGELRNILPILSGQLMLALLGVGEFERNVCNFALLGPKRSVLAVSYGQWHRAINPF